MLTNNRIGLHTYKMNQCRRNWYLGGASRCQYDIKWAMLGGIRGTRFNGIDCSEEEIANWEQLI